MTHDTILKEAVKKIIPLTSKQLEVDRVKLTITKIVQQALEKQREEIKVKCEKYKIEQCSDPWSYGMNIDMTNGYARAMEDIISSLSQEKKKEEHPNNCNCRCHFPPFPCNGNIPCKDCEKKEEHE
jgi:hypothetical protein